MFSWAEVESSTKPNSPTCDMVTPMARLVLQGYLWGIAKPEKSVNRDGTKLKTKCEQSQRDVRDQSAKESSQKGHGTNGKLLAVEPEGIIKRVLAKGSQRRGGTNGQLLL